MKNQTILVLDFGGQYKELIARSVRRMNVYSVVEPSCISEEKLKEIDPIGIILRADRTAFILKILPVARRRCSIWVCLSWAFATACNIWRIPLAEWSKKAPCANTDKPRCLSATAQSSTVLAKKKKCSWATPTTLRKFPTGSKWWQRRRIVRALQSQTRIKNSTACNSTPKSNVP